MSVLPSCGSVVPAQDTEALVYALPINPQVTPKVAPVAGEGPLSFELVRNFSSVDHQAKTLYLTSVYRVTSPAGTARPAFRLVPLVTSGGLTTQDQTPFRQALNASGTVVSAAKVRLTSPMTLANGEVVGTPELCNFERQPAQLPPALTLKLPAQTQWSASPEGVWACPAWSQGNSTLIGLGAVVPLAQRDLSGADPFQLSVLVAWLE
ncbi:MAG: hypothetical protein Q4C67_09340 [Deinococcus sp.]|nr:hypothetical protein [Deinococcus sp.]